MISLIALGLAFALFVAHLLDGRMPRGYVLAAFIASAIIAAGDIREYAGQVCTTATVDGETRTTCTVQYTVKSEALMAFIASVGFVALALFLEFFERLGRAVGGWDV